MTATATGIDARHRVPMPDIATCPDCGTTVIAPEDVNLDLLGWHRDRGCAKR